jgi:hypothetical protein
MTISAAMNARAILVAYWVEVIVCFLFIVPRPFPTR